LQSRNDEGVTGLMLAVYSDIADTAALFKVATKKGIRPAELLHAKDKFGWLESALSYSLFPSGSDTLKDYSAPFGREKHTCCQFQLVQQEGYGVFASPPPTSRH